MSRCMLARLCRTPAQRARMFQNKISTCLMVMKIANTRRRVLVSGKGSVDDYMVPAGSAFHLEVI